MHYILLILQVNKYMKFESLFFLFLILGGVTAIVSAFARNNYVSVAMLFLLKIPSGIMYINKRLIYSSGRAETTKMEFSTTLFPSLLTFINNKLIAYGYFCTDIYRTDRGLSTGNNFFSLEKSQITYSCIHNAEYLTN